MLLYICLSSHGYGHAARQASILKQIYLLKPDWRFIVSSAIDLNFLKLVFSEIPVEFRYFRWDIGMIQNNAISVNIEQTILSLKKLQSSLPHHILNEAHWLKSQSSNIAIIGDIPPSASSLAALLEAPLIWIGNFGWDDIYQSFGSYFDEYIEEAKNNYSLGDLLLRLPFSLPMDWGIAEERIGITCSPHRQLPCEFSKHLEAINKPLILISFGGIQMEFDFGLFNNWTNFHFLTPKIKSLPKRSNTSMASNFTYIPSTCRVLDVLPFCERFITKPGYSSFCEGISSDVGIHTVLRPDFSESLSLIEGLRQYSFHKCFEYQDLISGNWFLDQQLTPPTKRKPISNGSLSAALSVVNLIK